MSRTALWPTSAPADLLAVKRLVYDPCGFVCSPLSPENEGRAYGAQAFQLDGRSVRSRVAKLTPTKNGLFVTVWKRPVPGPIQPFDPADGIDLVVVTAREGQHFGQFVFPTAILGRQGIVASAPGVGEGGVPRKAGPGKRAFRVYPPWTVTGSGQATRTAAWQRPYFLPIDESGTGLLDLERARVLYRG